MNFKPSKEEEEGTKYHVICVGRNGDVVRLAVIDKFFKASGKKEEKIELN
jgi:hypothetical protein